MCNVYIYYKNNRTYAYFDKNKCDTPSGGAVLSDPHQAEEQGREYKRSHGGAIRLINNTSVEPKVPVVIDYYTLYPNPKTGTLDTWGDIYGYDPILLKAIKPYLP